MPNGVRGARVGHAFREPGQLHITSAGYYWVVTPEQAFGELALAYGQSIHRAVSQLAQRYAPVMENWMKENAPWTDRTANARQGLYTEVTENIARTMIAIILSHGVHYGLFLEVKQAGKYAIVNPAIDYWGPKIWADVRAMLGR